MAIKFLYVKQHSVTGLKYFGMTSNDPFKYRGSGTYWRRHVKKHGGFKYVETIKTWKFDDIELCSDFALRFSEENNIVESKEWANEVPEDGLSGYPKGIKRSKETIDKMRKPKSEEHRQNISKAMIARSVDRMLSKG